MVQILAILGNKSKTDTSICINLHSIWMIHDSVWNEVNHGWQGQEKLWQFKNYINKLGNDFCAGLKVNNCLGYESNLKILKIMTTS